MSKADNIKEKLISATTELIIGGTGNIAEITTRAIAEKAGAGIGLVNYHFQTKENLIEICVQQIIGKVISSFQVAGSKSLTDFNRLLNTATRVFDFLFENPAVSRISILGDFRSPAQNDNTAKTIKGFASSLREHEIHESGKSSFAFMLVSVMQAAFLRKDICKELFGCDLIVKSERDNFIENIVRKMFGGFGNE